MRDDKMREKAINAYSILLAVMGCDTRNVMEYGKYVLVLAFLTNIDDVQVVRHDD